MAKFGFEIEILTKIIVGKEYKNYLICAEIDFTDFRIEDIIA